jgi:hypothetical protein
MEFFGILTCKSLASAERYKKNRRRLKNGCRCLGLSATGDRQGDEKSPTTRLNPVVGLGSFLEEQPY